MSELANLESLMDINRTGIEANELFGQELTAHRQFPGAWPAETVQIENGILTPAHAFVVVDTEGSAPADDLELIAVTNTHDGMELKLMAQDSRAITVRHNPGAVHGIALADGANMTLPTNRFILLKRYGDRWREIVGGNEFTTLSANRTIYVRTTGTSTGDGLTEATAVATLAQAMALVNKINPGNYSVIVNVGPGSFAGLNWNTPSFNHRNLYIQGAGNDSTIITSNLYVHSSVAISNCTLQGTLGASNGGFVYVIAFSGTHTIRFSRIVSGAAITASEGGYFGITTNSTIELSGVFSQILTADRGGDIIFASSTKFIFIDSTSFTTFAQVARGANIAFYSTTFEGKEKVTSGTKYNYYQGGQISHHNDRTLEILPGTTPTIDVTNYAVANLKVPPSYELGEFYFFRHPTLRPGFMPAQGGLLANAATLYPQIWAYLQTTEGQLLCKTEAEWQALTRAIWHTNADGTTVGWDGIGGAPWFAPNFATGALRLPDVRGMVAEAAGCDSLGVGGVHGDAGRRLLGYLPGYLTSTSGSPQAVATSALYWGVTGSRVYQMGSTFDGRDQLTIDSQRTQPVANKVQPRAFGSNCCVYLGKQAS